MTRTGIAVSSPDGFPTLSVGRWVKVMVILCAVAVVGLLVCLQFGTERIPLSQIARIVMNWSHEQMGAETQGINPSVILLDVRLPRLLVAFLVGASLAAVGVSLQALLRNPLADPFILGISGGAALGAAMAVQLGLAWAGAGFSAVELLAFLGAGMTMWGLYRVAMADGKMPVYTLLLAGVIINAVLSALILFISSLLDSTSAFRLFFWLMGSLASLAYPSILVLALYVVIGIGLLCGQARNLNLLAIGEAPAQTPGLDVEHAKPMIFFTSALLTGAAVAVSGLIGFVGMMIPHAVRMVLGPDHRLLLPSSAILGGCFLATADTIARTVLAPTELPVGVITALCGGPFFIYLLVNKRRAQMG